MTTQPHIIRTKKELRTFVSDWKEKGLRVGFVPTMGALHEGHLSLVRKVQSQSDRIVVSIFVNPTQFAPHEDFDDYPRQEQADIERLTELGVELVYTPSRDEMYGQGFATSVKVGGPSKDLCGGARPHFFEGVAIVVTKLLMQVSPDVAIFGEKDYQQLLVIRRLVSDLDIPTKIISGATAREDDGLAISSRNQYLSASKRPVAAQLNQILRQTAHDLKDASDIKVTLDKGAQALLDAGFKKVDYLDLRDAQDLSPITNRIDASCRLLVAAWLGNTRLIDNIAVELRKL